MKVSPIPVFEPKATTCLNHILQSTLIWLKNPTEQNVIKRQKQLADLVSLQMWASTSITQIYNLKTKYGLPKQQLLDCFHRTRDQFPIKLVHFRHAAKNSPNVRETYETRTIKAPHMSSRTQNAQFASQIACVHIFEIDRQKKIQGYIY